MKFISIFNFFYHHTYFTFTWQWEISNIWKLTLDDKYLIYLPYWVGADIPVIRLNANDGSVSLTKSYSGWSQSLSGAAFSNSLYTYVSYWTSGGTLAVLKLLSSDFSISGSYQYTVPGYSGYKAFLDKLSRSDSSDQVLFTVGPDSTSTSTPNFLLIKHDFSIANPLVSVHEINPGSTTGNRFSRFKKYNLYLSFLYNAFFYLKHYYFTLF